MLINKDKININYQIPYKIAFISDTHLGSVNEDLYAINKAYEIIDKNKIKKVFHLGDLTDGTASYSTEKLKIIGAIEQADYFASVYPHIPGIVTFCISGNHDNSHIFEEGIDVVKYIAGKRKDILPFTNDKFQIVTEDTHILLKHYFVSEELNNMPKIDIAIQGHYHKFNYYELSNLVFMIIPSLSNIVFNMKDVGFVIGTFEEQYIEFANYHIYDKSNVNIKRYIKKIR